MTRTHDSQYRPAPDPYAAHRCACRHLVYPDTCRWCDCHDHKPKEPR